MPPPGTVPVPYIIPGYPGPAPGPLISPATPGYPAPGAPGYPAAPGAPGYPAPAGHYLHFPGYPTPAAGHYPAPGYPTPAAPPSLIAPPGAPGTAPGAYNYPPPSAPGPSHYNRDVDRDRSPVRDRDGRGRYSDDRDYRDRRHRHGTSRRDRSRDRGDRRRRRYSPDRDRDRRHRDKEDRDREKMRQRREKEKKENIPSAYKKDKPAPLVPYENDSDEAEENNDQDRSRRRSGSRKNSRDTRSSSPRDIKPEKDFSKLSPEEIIEQEKKVWISSAPADLYYERDKENPCIMKATQKSLSLLNKFQEKVITGSVKEREKFPIEAAPRIRAHVHNDASDDSDDDDEDHAHNHKIESIEWMNTRSKAANRAHEEVWFNVSGELNDGPACRCSKTAQEAGIRHGIYVGETEMPDLEPNTNNFDKLYHYRVTISPPTNFLIKHPTIIHHDHHEFIFEGFSMFTVDKIPEVPVCKVVRFNIEYNILYFEEKMPENFTLSELDAFHQYFFYELLELWDWSVDKRFYFMPRFVRDLSENGKEILSMNEVISYMLSSYTPLIEE